MKKFALATLALAMGTALIAAPQAPTDKSKAPATTTDSKGKKPKKEKKPKTEHKGDAKADKSKDKK